MAHAQRPAVLDLIGNTPLIEVTRLDTGPCQLFLKLESQNPGGSIKDRVGLWMIEAAERGGQDVALHPSCSGGARLVGCAATSRRSKQRGRR